MSVVCLDLRFVRTRGWANITWTVPGAVWKRGRVSIISVRKARREDCVNLCHGVAVVEDVVTSDARIPDHGVDGGVPSGYRKVDRIRFWKIIFIGQILSKILSDFYIFR